MKFTHLLFLFALTPLQMACSSSLQQLNKTTQESNTKIEVFNRYGELVHQGFSSDAIKLASNNYKQEKYQIRFIPIGYSARTLRVSMRANHLYFSNINISSSSDTLIIDPITGAMFTGSLKLKSVIGKVAPGAFKVLSLHDVPPDYRGQLVTL